MTLTNGALLLVAFIIVLFLLFSKKMKELANAALAFKAKWVEINEAEKTGSPPPHVHGLTMTEPRKIDIAKMIPERRRTPPKPHHRTEDE